VTCEVKGADGEQVIWRSGHPGGALAMRMSKLGQDESHPLASLMKRSFMSIDQTLPRQFGISSTSVPLIFASARFPLKSIPQSIGHDKTPFIKYVHFFIRLTPTYRMHRTRLDNELRRAIHESRRQAEQSQEAENTVDLMVGKGGSKRDELAENEMRDELLTCPQTSSSVLENGLTLIDVDLLGGTETTAMTFCWVNLTSSPGIAPTG